MLYIVSVYCKLLYVAYFMRNMFSKICTGWAYVKSWVGGTWIMGRRTMAGPEALQR